MAQSPSYIWVALAEHLLLHLQRSLVDLYGLAHVAELLVSEAVVRERRHSRWV